MRRLSQILLPMIVATLVMVAPAGAHHVRPQVHMTTTQKIAYYKLLVWHDHQQMGQAQHVFRFFTNHRRILVSARTHDVAWHEIGKWQKIETEHRGQLKFARHRLALLLAQVNPYPPHHDLWVCISHFEGGVTSVNPNGHYGMLQMHANWGYGTSEYASDDSQPVQEWAAERAYAASGYSSAFLYGQWFNWDGAADTCLGDA